MSEASRLKYEKIDSRPEVDIVTIKLTAEHEEIIRDSVRRGHFGSVEVALNQALQSIASIPVASNRLTPAEAAARLRELRKGNLLPPGTTICDLIEHGRA